MCTFNSEAFFLIFFIDFIRLNIKNINTCCSSSLQVLNRNKTSLFSSPVQLILLSWQRRFSAPHPPPKKKKRKKEKKKRNTDACTTNITYMYIQRIIFSISQNIKLSKFHIPKLLNITHSLIYIKFKYLQLKWDDLWILNAILTPNSLSFVCGVGVWYVSLDIFRRDLVMK